jgi:FkbM family methyltransferase
MDVAPPSKPVRYSAPVNRTSTTSAAGKIGPEPFARPPLGARLNSGLRRLWFGKRKPERSKVVRCRYFGARLAVRLEDEAGYEIALRRYEWCELAWMIEACRRIQPAVFIDVGANLGLYSCVLGHNKLAPRILALEPDRENFAALAANLKLNGLTETSEAREIGAAARSGAAVLVPAGAIERGASRLDVTAQDGEAGAYAVEVVALDDLARLDDAAVAAKIDAPGSEIEVLMGAAQLFTRNRGYAQIDARGNRAAGVITELMAAFGWRRVGRQGAALRFEKP